MRKYNFGNELKRTALVGALAVAPYLPGCLYVNVTVPKDAIHVESDAVHVEDGAVTVEPNAITVGSLLGMDDLGLEELVEGTGIDTDSLATAAINYLNSYQPDSENDSEY